METELGRREIEGQPAEGFEIVQDTDTCAQTVTVWAHAMTGKPLLVIIDRELVGWDSPSMKLILRDFNLDVGPEEEL